MKQHNPREYYTNTLRSNEQKSNKARKVSRWIGVIRMLLFLFFCYSIYLIANETSPWIILFSIIPYIALHLFDIKFQAYSDDLDTLIDILKTEINSLDGDLSNHYDGKEFTDHKHEYSHDLEIFGPNSLFQFINRTATKEGAENLAKLLETTLRSEEEIIELQEANRELSPLIEWRHQLRIPSWKKEVALTPMIESANKYESIIQHRWQIIAATFLTTTNITIILLSSFSLINPAFAIITVLSLLLATGLITAQMNKRLLFIDGTYKSMMSIHKILMLIHHQAPLFKSHKLKRITEPLCNDNNSFITEVKELNKILSALDQRSNLVVNILLNGLYLRDFWVTHRTDRWFKKNKHQIEIWSKNLAELDALCALSHIAYHYPETAYPTPSSSTIMDTEEMIHPLIFKTKAIGNPLHIKQDHLIHIITGANMAGKSTYLRTVGANLIFASVGAPVFASYMTFKPSALFSSMRSSDQLSEGISFFHAELLRLKQMKQHMQTHSNTFILLDEILKGTNSKDKLKGSEIVLEKILEYPASGIVATHDLELKKLEETFPTHFKNFCFEFEYQDEKIIFDYILRKGATEKMNASYLLEKIFLTDQ
ncbi:hypothetical protein K5X82_05230 [Halosquirtibacter xylanolyticus]|uniref:MutS-related protein n=1 Tax=Halosquirtibacter xylanolyticus TaxID=3374599 RepID=UPI003747F42A|nr:hypothetical protein K5X82_05230 [Prolixibacteraceae bacterium]